VANNYTGGITYKPTDDLTIAVDDDARIFPSSGNDRIDVTFAGGDVNIEMNGKIITQGDYDWGIRVYDPAGLVTILNQGSINTLGENAHGISVYTANGVSEVMYGAVATSGASSHGINVFGTNGTVNATLRSVITTEGPGSHGIAIYRTDGDVNVTQTGRYAKIVTDGDGSSGIFIYDTNGSVSVIAGGSGSLSSRAALTTASSRGTERVPFSALLPEQAKPSRISPAQAAKPTVTWRSPGFMAATVAVRSTAMPLSNMSITGRICGPSPPMRMVRPSASISSAARWRAAIGSPPGAATCSRACG
jgi:hypothetical protein